MLAVFSNADRLREYIGKIYNVYMVSITNFSEYITQHLKDLETITAVLRKASMKISLVKSKF